MELVVDESNMSKAWSKVKANKGAPGPDGISLEVFFESFRHQWPTVGQALLDGSYQPSPARRKAIPKPDGSFRNLGIPNVVDRLIQQAILQVLTPIFDPGFSESSFCFRPKRSAHGAVKQVQHHIRSGYRQCVDMDLSKFFDRVDHTELLARVSRKVSDPRLLRLISRYLRAGVTRTRYKQLDIVAKTRSISELNLSSTKVLDAGLEHLYGLRSLKLLRLTNTSVSTTTIEKLKRELPGLVVEQ